MIQATHRGCAVYQQSQKFCPSWVCRHAKPVVVVHVRMIAVPEDAAPTAVNGKRGSHDHADDPLTSAPVSGAIKKVVDERITIVSTVELEGEDEVQTHADDKFLFIPMVGCIWTYASLCNTIFISVYKRMQTHTYHSYTYSLSLSYCCIAVGFVQEERGEKF